MASKNTAERVVGITDYFISLPPTRYLVLSIIILGFILGIIINFSKYKGIELILKGSLDGTLLLSIPALLSSVVIKIMIRKTPFKRIIATTLAGEIVYAVAYVTSFFLSAANLFYAEITMLVGAAMVFVLWYLIARLVFVLRFRSILFAVIQLLFHLFFLLNSNSLYSGNDPLISIAKFYIAAFVLLMVMFIFFFIVNAPLKKSFGVSSTDAFSHVIGQWLYKDTALEEMFETLGQDARVLVSFISFKRKKDSLFLIIPCVHFGPFGTLGGSEFSYLISNELYNKYNAKTLVFHGTVTHDLNPVSSKELGKIISACDSCIKEAKYKDAKISFSIGKEQECVAEALVINNNAFIGLTRAPQVTEDINFGVGLSIISTAEKKISVAAVADQHNSETGEITTFEPGDKTSFSYMQAVDNALSKKPSELPLAVGYADMYPSYQFIGKAGVKVLIFSSYPEYVLILVDSNGVTPDFREKLIFEIKELGLKYKKNWHVGIYTTDTHQINVVRGVRNPMREDKNFSDEIKNTVIKAMNDMQPSKSYATKKWFDIRVIGPKQSIEIASTLNATLSIAKLIAPLLLLGGIAAILLILRIFSM